MKRTFILGVVFLIFGGAFFAHAQDMIVLHTGETIEAQVLEISPTEIRYRRFDHLDGPIIVIPAAQVLLVIYEGGRQEVITAAPVTPGGQGAVVPSPIGGDPRAQRAIDTRGAAFALNFILGFGIGSYVQGDTTGGTIGLIGDLVSWTFLIIGAIPEEEWVSTGGGWGYWETRNNSDALVILGFLGLVGGRVFQSIRPFSYANSFSVALAPTFDNNGQPALATALRFSF